MDKTYNHKAVEGRIYKMWEEGGYFTPRIRSEQARKPFTIILPPPNASGKMHIGNVLMIAIEDLLIRWHRMKGDPALWVPGTDHAGYETQVTFERELKKQGKSRFSFSREELYRQIWDFVQTNNGLIEGQIRQMGASVDWSRYIFTLDDKVIDTVYKTFEKMTKEGLVYRGDYMVNYCPKCGTTFADLEVVHIERKDPLYYMKYGPFVLATVRPETKFGDTAMAVHPEDKRYKEYIGKEIEVDGLVGKFKLKVIADKYVNPKFGTGVVKVTPAHDKNDYEAGLRHKLEIKSVIDWNGRLNEKAGKYKGLSVLEARKQVVEDLQKKGLLEKIDKEYSHTVAVCYKGNHDIEPMVLPNWFIKVEDLKKPALAVVRKGEVKIYPKWREKTYYRWMEEMRDWPISRQIVWGIRIPVWYKVDKSVSSMWVYWLDKNGKLHQGNLIDFLKNGVSLGEIESGLQRLIVLSGKSVPKWVISREKPKDGDYLPETDTFDTWFSSGHWPLVTLGYPDSEDFKYFYPTSVLETGWEILRLWVSRMIMFGLYLTGKPPFKFVYLHGIVKALDGRKMSKSLGNVINPEEYIEEFGVDALRMGLISGTANGKDFNFPKDKVIAYKHFANKIWNMGRFIEMNQIQNSTLRLRSGLRLRGSDSRRREFKIQNFDDLDKKRLTSSDKEILKELSTIIQKVDKELEKFRFADAGEAIYHFMWHKLADKYIEHVKNRKDKAVALSVLRHVYFNCLKILHPFMPFVTEEIWGKLVLSKVEGIPKIQNAPLIISSWPR